MCYNNMNMFFKEGDVMQIIPMHTGDTLELKKPHPCGEHYFKVVRVGSEIRIVCTGCGRDMTMDRVKLERAVKRVIPSPDPVD